ncbi:hypothetical protein SERLA73DRAFT_190280 [Serpula lacrymans var. lacrymans S7.3]|uniref:Methyltransferase domain-containing protein n=2 Tax=Serpula lacrymans var. lacrymans TaxID=341189 RepID=F8QFD8_SERL3|nr:uncharacterized protein SERLADRAFT_479293 [Serpula lacrymans var. lacrymans S7.9]EGN92922.1 hypothetical protein SERLA73DRAFT_190280 [Serpula lacrymans var. lacrymans S7.3]EGO19644.1 hypothetical protein SERLADRAFT_479293 [Serpula lacrymans var. lacrymans S7.9]
MRLTRHWVYEDVLKLGKTGDDNFFLDIGCCMGTDVRKLVVDGYPPNKVIASDLCSEFWDIGKKLFKADAEGDKIRFIQEDITELDPKALESMPSPDNTLAAPNTLSDLHQRCSVIHISYVFHFFSKEQQYNLACTLASLLSPKPGSIIFGAQVGLAEAGERTSAMGYKTFGQCPLSWKELWVGEGGVFSADAAECEAKLFEPEPKDAITPNPIDKKPYLLKWSVKRL